MKSDYQAMRLADCCTHFGDGDWIETKDQSSDGIRLVQTGNIGEGEYRDKGHKARYISDETFDRLRCTEVLPGDCLVSRLPEPVGRACVVPDLSSRMITGVDCSIIRFDGNRLLSSYFVYYSQSEKYLAAVDAATTGTTRSLISRKNLGNVLVPVPPVQEQRRIVAILDDGFEGVAQANANAATNLRNASGLFESELEAIFAQGGRGWATERLGDITTKIGSGATPRGGRESYKSAGTPLIRSMNVHDRGFRESGLAFIDDLQAAKLSNVEVRAGDVLLNITGASVARCCVAPEAMKGARVNQHVSIIRPDPEVIDARLLHCLLTSKSYKDRLLGIGAEGGSTRQAITKAQIADFEVTYPRGLDEQLSLVSRIDDVFRETSRLESIYQRKLAELASLKKSLLNEAFVGNL